MLQVTITQKSVDSQLEEHLSLRPTKLRPAGKSRGLETFVPNANIVFLIQKKNALIHI